MTIDRLNAVTIHRDEWGVPHVRAASEEAGFYGVGYAQAEDHLELITSNYWLLRGELAAHLDERRASRSIAKVREAAKIADLTQLRWRHLAESRAAYPRLSAELRRNTEAFLAGVQRFADDHPERVKVPLPPLEPAMPMAMVRTIWFDFALRDALRVGILADVPFEPAVSELAEVIRTRRRPVGASNEWVLLPWRTADNALMLLSDPHGDLNRLQMSEVEVEAGTIKYIGYHIVGAVMPMLGHTRDVAWGYTTGGPVVSDCYAVEVTSEDERLYLYDGEKRSMVSHEAEVRSEGETEPLRRRLDYTTHNDVLCPVVGRSDGVAYAISTPYMHVPDLYEEQMYAQIRARNVGEFRAAMNTVGEYSQNVMAGDRHGDACYVRMGRTPIRPAGVDINKPLDGNTSATAWLGIHPLEDLVQIGTPACGYLANNNVAPDCMLLDVRGTTLEAANYPDYVFGDTPGRNTSRGRRILELLPRAYHATVDDAIAWATDEKWIGVNIWQTALDDALNAFVGATLTQEATFFAFVDRVLHFDGFARSDSVAALNYWFWRTSMLNMDEISDAMLDKVDTCERLDADEQWALVSAALKAVATLLATYGRTDVSLGEVFRIGRAGRSWPGRAASIQARKARNSDNPFDVVAPLQVMDYGEPDLHGQRWGLRGSHTLRLTVFTEPIQSFALLLFGQSTHASSPHYADQCQLFSKGMLRRTYFTDAELLDHIVATKELTF